MRTLGPVTFTFIEPRDLAQINRLLQFDLIQHTLHALVKLLGPENMVIPPTVGDKRRDVARHGRPVNVRIHWFAKLDGVARKQQKASEHRDLIKVALYVNPILLA